MITKLVTQNRLCPADVIVAKKKSGVGRIFYHYIVYAGNNLFIGNLKGNVKWLSTMELLDLLKDYEPVRIRRFNGSLPQRKQALKRAYSRLGDKYSLPVFNCEHFANWVQKGKESSAQVNIAISLIALGLVYKFSK